MFLFDILTLTQQTNQNFSTKRQQKAHSPNTKQTSRKCQHARTTQTFPLAPFDLKRGEMRYVCPSFSCDVCSFFLWLTNSEEAAAIFTPFLLYERRQLSVKFSRVVIFLSISSMFVVLIAVWWNCWKSYLYSIITKGEILAMWQLYVAAHSVHRGVGTGWS